MSLLARLRGMDGYRHLREEIETYRGAEAIRALLLEAGLTEYGRMPLTGGIAVLHTATAPAPAATAPASAAPAPASAAPAAPAEAEQE